MYGVGRRRDIFSVINDSERNRYGTIEINAIVKLSSPHVSSGKFESSSQTATVEAKYVVKASGEGLLNL